MTVRSSELSQLPALIGIEQACALLGISRSAGYRLFS
jgi:predicted DNA-binding transcriptional regulator AlpA